MNAILNWIVLIYVRVIYFTQIGSWFTSLSTSQPATQLSLQAHIDVSSISKHPHSSSSLNHQSNSPQSGNLKVRRGEFNNPDITKRNRIPQLRKKKTQGNDDPHSGFWRIPHSRFSSINRCQSLTNRYANNLLRFLAGVSARTEYREGMGGGRGEGEESKEFINSIRWPLDVGQNTMQIISPSKSQVIKNYTTIDQKES